MKQTAVEFLIEELSKNGYNFQNYQDEVKQAKEIEKQQIIDARVNGMCAGIDISDKSIEKDLSHTHEQYYNETFKNNQ